MGNENSNIKNYRFKKIFRPEISDHIKVVFYQ